MVADLLTIYHPKEKTVSKKVHNDMNMVRHVINSCATRKKSDSIRYQPSSFCWAYQICIYYLYLRLKKSFFFQNYWHNRVVRCMLTVMQRSTKPYNCTMRMVTSSTCPFLSFQCSHRNNNLCFLLVYVRKRICKYQYHHFKNLLLALHVCVLYQN